MDTSAFTKRPSIIELAYRCMCLRADRFRFLIEMSVGQKPTQQNIDEKKIRLEELKVWAEKENLFQHMTKAEKKRFRKDLGQWNNADVTTGSFADIIHQILVWGCGMDEEIPSPERPYRKSGPADEIPLLLDAATWMNCVGLRSYAELVRERDLALVYYLRLAAVEAFRKYKLSEGEQQRFIAKIMDVSRERQTQIEIANGDFLFKGKPITQITKQECDMARYTLICRLAALTWLSGDRPDWDEPIEEFFNKNPEWMRPFHV